MAYWLFKSEPESFSFDDLVARGEDGQEWDGVHNYQARNHMRSMKAGDLGFYYHSGDAKEVVGIVEVIAGPHADSTDKTGTWECVDIRVVRPLPQAVPLAAVKEEPRLAGMSLVTNSRLSVQPVTDAEWEIVRRMGGEDPAA